MKHLYTYASSEDLLRQLQLLRQRLQSAYRPDTAAPGFVGTTPSTGQCAATSVIARESLGGEMVSAKVHGQSHWFNRFRVKDTWVDADITGDQFGLPVLQSAPQGQLYADTRVRPQEHLNEETLRRARLLAQRAGALDIVAAVDAVLTSHRQSRTAG